MLPYYILIVPIAVMAAFAPSRRPNPVLWALAFLAIVVFVGLRHHVGMDWNNYIIMIQRANSGDIWNALDRAEPGFAILLWISGQTGWGVYGTYLVGTIIYAAGVFKYAKTTPSPWMAILVALPYLTIVVAMAAARQTIAIGVLFWLVAVWDDCPTWKRIALVLLACMFHSSAVFFLLFVFLDLKSHWMMKLTGSVIAAAGAFHFLQSSGQIGYYDEAYVSGQTEGTQSDGALFHVLLNGGPAFMAFMLGRRMRALLIPNDLHRYMAVAALILVPASLVFSTASSRLTLYLFPVSMYIFAALAFLFVKSDRIFVRTTLAALFVALLAFWLNYSNSARAYNYYQNALLLPPHQLLFCCR